MAGIKHSISTTYKNDAGNSVVSDVLVLTAAAEENFREVVLAGATLEIDLRVDVSQIVSFFIESTQAVGFDTNAVGGAGGQTMQLAAKVALAWNNTDQINVNPLTVDTTKLFFINAGATDATVVGGFLLDL